jgi:hypothetical protein
MRYAESDPESKRNADTICPSNFSLPPGLIYPMDECIKRQIIHTSIGGTQWMNATEDILDGKLTKDQCTASTNQLFLMACFWL